MTVAAIAYDIQPLKKTPVEKARRLDIPVRFVCENVRCLVQPRM